MATPANAKTDALVNILADWLAKVEVETLGERKTKDNVKAQVGAQPEKITKCKLTHLVTYCLSWRLTCNLDTSVQAKARKRAAHMAKHQAR